MKSLIPFLAFAAVAVVFSLTGRDQAEAQYFASAGGHPEARDIVNIYSSVTVPLPVAAGVLIAPAYTVPSDKYLVLTDYRFGSSKVQGRLVESLGSAITAKANPDSWVHPNTGLVFRPGSLVQFETTSAYTDPGQGLVELYAQGYLTPR